MSRAAAGVDPEGDTGPGSEEFFHEIGRELRAVRLERGLSLAALASRCGLSQSFLSQMERGLVRASFRSLNQVTKALGTTTQEVMALRTVARVGVVRSGEGGVLADVRLLVPGSRSIRVMELTGAPEEFGERYVHDEEELIYVADGVVEVETDDADTLLLGAGESVFLSAGVPHRWRRVGGSAMRVLLISQGTRARRTRPD